MANLFRALVNPVLGIFVCNTASDLESSWPCSQCFLRRFFIAWSKHHNVTAA